MTDAGPIGGAMYDHATDGQAGELVYRDGADIVLVGTPWELAEVWPQEAYYRAKLVR